MNLVNGLTADSLALNDRGLLYGDGVFRTMKRKDGVTLCWSRHYRKLASDCAAVRLSCPEAPLLESELGRLPSDCVAKIIITRGSGQRGYAVGPDVAVTRIVTSTDLPRYNEVFLTKGVRVHLCRLRLGHQPMLAGIKHLNRLENVLARMEWNDPEAPEGVLRDQGGDVIEGTMSNLFAYRGGELLTPDLTRCGVAGVQRERIMEAAEELGIAVRVTAVSLETLMEADEVMLCNSLFGIWKVRELNGRSWAGEGIVRELRDFLDRRDD